MRKPICQNVRRMEHPLELFREKAGSPPQTDFTFFLKVTDPRAGSISGAFWEARVKDQHVLVPWGLASLKPMPEPSVHGREGRRVYAPCLCSVIPVFSLCKT